MRGQHDTGANVPTRRPAPVQTRFATDGSVLELYDPDHRRTAWIRWRGTGVDPEAKR